MGEEYPLKVQVFLPVASFDHQTNGLTIKPTTAHKLQRGCKERGASQRDGCRGSWRGRSSYSHLTRRRKLVRLTLEGSPSKSRGRERSSWTDAPGSRGTSPAAEDGLRVARKWR